MSFDDVHDEGNVICPYCSRTGECSHVLLVVDKTFRTAEGGVLMNAFNNRWDSIIEDGGSDFDEREHFESLLEEVDSMATAESEYEFEGGPGMSSVYGIYFIATENSAKDALSRFSNAE
jgi:uncharacterized protein YbaR (Trm112 family)